MNIPIDIIYLTSSSIAVFAMVPQIRQLIAAKRSDELSLGTWITWGCCQLVSLAYALSVQITAYIIVSTAWIVFYVIMVFLIIKYRKKRNILQLGLDYIRQKRARQAALIGGRF